MQPLKLTIPGKFWDSQIYAGRLYLFRTDGSLFTLNWDSLIEDWLIDPQHRVAFECAFRRSDYLYKPEFSLLFSDEELKRVIERKFASLLVSNLIVDASQLEQAKVGEQDSPFPFPHASCTIYSSQMYTGSQSGLFQASCSKQTKNPVSSRARKMWDGSVFSIAASYNEIAVAAGDDGLFEIPARESSHPEYTPRLEISCTFCEWAFQSIFCSSQDRGGYLADFSKRYSRLEGTSRNFEQVFSAEDIFGAAGFSWGRQDKFYLASSLGIQVIQYRPWQDDRVITLETTHKSVERLDVQAGGVAFFGTVLELQDSLLILLSDGNQYVINGDPVSWKIFPRSRHYENHLHVVFEDRLEVYSFNQDYFVDQRSKLFGNSYLPLEFSASSPSKSFFGKRQPDRSYGGLLTDDDDEPDPYEVII